MDTIITINGKRVLCSEANISGNKNLDSQPNANVDGPVEVQTLAFENLQIDLNNVKFPLDAPFDPDVFRWLDLLDMLTHKYVTTNPYILNIKVRGVDIVGTRKVGGVRTKDIKVVLDSFSFPINASYSRDGYMVNASMTLLETK
jgi:hypothetical protein